jgi:hypothetical protein
MGLELFEPGEYLDQRRSGYFTVGARPGGTWRQDSYELKLLPTVVEHADRNVDTYITQAVFNTPTRRAVNLQSVGLLFADLDTYNHDKLKAEQPEDQALQLADYCRREGLPAPSIVLFSGRGLQAKWLLIDALGVESLPRWNAAQIALVRLLAPFAADKAARDISRVLRLDRTVNTKSGEYCRVVWTASGSDECPARYDFTLLYETLTAQERDPADKSTTPKSKHRVRAGGRLLAANLNWLRLCDLRALWTLRGGVPVGYRELTLFWQLNFLLMAEPGRASDVWNEAQSLAAEIDNHSGWYSNTDLSTLYRKAKALRAGGVEYQGRTYPALYTPRNATLIDLFQITSEEERKMWTIISSDEKYRRKVERRRAAGVQARKTFGTVKPWEVEGISRRWWYELQKRKRQECTECPLSWRGGRGEGSEPILKPF